MAKNYISKVKVGSSYYEVKDLEAREQIGGLSTRVSNIEGEIAGGVHFIGVVDTTKGDPVTEGSHNSSIYIQNVEDRINVEAGDVVLQGSKEFIWDGIRDQTYSGTWHEVGDQQAFNSHKHTYDKSSVNHTVTNPEMTSTGNFIPVGDIQVNEASGTGTSYTPLGSITVGGSTGVDVVTGGRCDGGSVTLTGADSNKLVTTTVLKVSEGPSVVKTTASAVAVGEGNDAETLIIGDLSVLGTDSTVATGTKLPKIDVSSGNNQTVTVATGSTSSEGTGAGIPTGGGYAAPTFHADTAALGFSGTEKKLRFSGTQGSVSVKGTPSVSIADHTYTTTNTSTAS